MIRPIDLQTSIFSAQNAPTAQRAEEGLRTDAQAAQAAFAADLSRRDESVAPTAEVLHNRVGAKTKEDRRQDGRPPNHPARTPFEQVVEDVAAASDDAPHIIDLRA